MAGLAVFNWCPRVNASGKVKFGTRSAQFGDGYAQYANNGLNQKNQSWDLQFTGDAAYVDPITSFFDALEGFGVFAWTPPGGVLGLYRASAYDKTAYGRVYNLSVTFEQAYGTTTTSLAAVAPTITTPLPSTMTVLTGSAINLRIVVSGSVPFTYAWKRNGVSVGGNSANLDIVSATAADNGVYTVTITNSEGSTTSAGAAVTVQQQTQAPVITAQPGDKAVNAGAKITLAVTATGDAPLIYQWQKQDSALWLNIADSNSPTYTIPAAATGDAGLYRVSVTNSGGTTFSENATVTVQ